MANIVSFGGGVNSTALLVLLYEKNEYPDSILFADTRGEKPGTYLHLEAMQGWLKKHDMPEITIVKEANGLEDDCLSRDTLPSKAFGFGSCSERFKVRPQHRWVKQNGISDAMWLVGIHAGESARANRKLNQRDDVRFPLIEWNVDQSGCEAAINRAGIEMPIKSACFFCPSMRKSEVIQLSKSDPELFQRAVDMESAALESGRMQSVKGLGRQWSWSALVNADEKQLKLFPDNQSPLCDQCVDW